jgi:hypothetical protein
MIDYSYYGNQRALNPYISFGLHYSFYDTQVTSNYVGPRQLIDHDDDKFIVYIGEDNSKYDKWITKEASEAKMVDGSVNNHEQTIFNGKGSTFGLSAGLGLRYKVADSFNLIIDSRWQHFFSDRVDGLDASKDPGNKYNDTMIYVNLGIVYVFGHNY